MAFFDQAFSGGGAPQMGGIGGLGGGGSPSAFTSPGMSPQALAMLMAMGRGAAPGGGAPMGAGAAPQMGAPPSAMSNATPTPGVGMANQPPNNMQQIMQLLAALKGGGGAGGGLASLLGGAGGGVAPGALGMMGLPPGTSTPQFTNSVMGAAGIPGY